MKIRVLAIISFIASGISMTPAFAAESRVVTDASAYVRADLGYLVGWKVPTNTAGIIGYTVTANPGGKTCYAAGTNSSKCTFTTATLGFKETYTFTIKVKTATEEGPASAPSNSVKYASIPVSPSAVVAKTISPTQIDIAWVPSPEDGGAPLYGYRITYWPMLPNGDPDGTKTTSMLALKTNASLTGMSAGQPYVINVASCNAWGCNSADSWVYAATFKSDGTVTSFRAPFVINGGNASTTCWNAIWDGGNASSTSSTLTKAPIKCQAAVVDPAKYPKIDPNATSKNEPVLATKFNQSMNIMFNKSYSLKEWSKTGGTPWSAYVYATTKSVTLGFEAPVTLTSATPTICAVEDKWVKFLAVGTCTINGSVAGTNAFTPATAKGSFQIIP